MLSPRIMATRWPTGVVWFGVAIATLGACDEALSHRTVEQRPSASSVSAAPRSLRVATVQNRVAVPPTPSATCDAIRARMAPLLGGAGRSTEGALFVGVEVGTCATMLAPSPRLLRLASLSKTVVAMAALRVFAARQLDLDRGVDAWLPNVAEARDRSLRQLLSHTSGLPSYDRAPGFWSAPNPRFSPEELLAFGRSLPQRKAPAPFSYANTNYVLVGMLLERLEGKPLPEILHAFLEPLGLGGIHPEEPGEPVEPTFDENGRRTGVRARPSMLYAAGDLVASLADVVHWTRAWGTGQLVPPSLERAWLTPTPTREGSDVAYGLGVFLQARKELGLVRSHAGNLAGLHAYAAYFPDLDAAVVAIATRDGLDPSRTALDAAQRIARARRGE